MPMMITSSSNSTASNANTTLLSSEVGGASFRIGDLMAARLLLMTVSSFNVIDGFGWSKDQL
jgi:hypothetical protein